MESSSLIKYLIQELEKHRKPVFSRKELEAISSKDFLDLSRKKILIYIRPSEKALERVSLPLCQHGCALTIVPMDDGFEAVCLKHPEEDPIPIERDVLNRYAFSVEAFLVQIRLANGISGQLHEIDKSCFYVGFKHLNEYRVGFAFFFRQPKKDSIALSGLRQLCKDDDIVFILAPSCSPESLGLQRIMRFEKIISLSLDECLDPQTFELPINDLVAKFLESETMWGYLKNIKRTMRSMNISVSIKFTFRVRLTSKVVTT